MLGDRYIGGIARVSLCSLQARVGEPTVAAQRFVDAIDHWRRQGATTHLVTALRNLPVLLDPTDIGLIALLSMAVAVVATLHPAASAAKLYPIEAIRSE